MKTTYFQFIPDQNIKHAEKQVADNEDPWRLRVHKRLEAALQFFYLSVESTDQTSSKW